jgi:hypothetical protein
MKEAIIRHPNGSIEWTPMTGDSYLVTGVDIEGRRFRMTCQTWSHARCINLWCGSKWLVRNGRRHLILRVSN